ncbi:MAG: HAD family hydrolase, partial [Gammaproteobacteria bacterium]|nr:HAD family hydrolase [Gammaproteobacteria bacterium]
MSLQALIFDVDGTLADTEREGHLIAFNQAFQKHGLDWQWSDQMYQELLAVTGGKERMRHYVTTHRPDYQQPDDFDELLAQIHKDKNQLYKALVQAGEVHLRPGVLRLFNEAKQKGIRLAIATTTTMENVEALFTYTLGADSLNWFEVIGAGDIVPKKKPAGDIYFYVMEKMGLKPEQCIAIEDSHNGIRSSLEANLATLITINDYTRSHDFSGAMAVVDSLGEPNQAAK